MRRVLAVIALLLCGPAFAETPFVLGWSYSPDVPQIAVAFDRDLWKTEDLAPKMVPFPSGRDALEALIGGQVDLAVMAEFPPATGALRNQKFSVLARLARYNRLRVIAKGPAALTSLKDLEGKKIGTTVGTNVHFVIADALAKAGVKAEIVNVGPSDVLPALTRGDIDAASMFPSAYAAAARALGAEYRELLLPDQSQEFLLVASEKAAGDPALLRRALAVLLKGEDAVAADPKAAQEATVKFVKSALTPEQIAKAWGDYDYTIDLTAATTDLLAKEGAWIRKSGFVRSGDPTPALYRSFMLPEPLRALRPDRVKLD